MKKEVEYKVDYKTLHKQIEKEIADTYLKALVNTLNKIEANEEDEFKHEYEEILIKAISIWT